MGNDLGTISFSMKQRRSIRDLVKHRFLKLLSRMTVFLTIKWADAVTRMISNSMDTFIRIISKAIVLASSCLHHIFLARNFLLVTSLSTILSTILFLCTGIPPISHLLRTHEFIPPNQLLNFYGSCRGLAPVLVGLGMAEVLIWD